MTGTGTITANALTNGGTIDPGNSAGTMTLTTNFKQTAGGHLAMEIGDQPTGKFDPVISDGQRIYLTGGTGLYALKPR